MNPKEQIPKPEESLDEIVDDAMSSVDDFIRELEAKEKDLHITADLTIEIEQSEYDPRLAPDILPEPQIDPEPQAASSSQNGASSRPRGAVEPGLKTRVFELEKEVESLHERIRELKSERNDIQEKSDRRLKDFESFKYRMDRERRGAFIDQIANLAAAMLPVLDNLDRALASVDKSKVDEMPEFSKFYDGIALVNQQVNEVLGEMGVEPIKTVGERFDPQFHEAVATEQREDVPNNSISEEMLRGYRIGNRVVRHSMVKVTLGGPASPKPATQDLASAEETDAEQPSAETAIEPAE
ncbi:MAG: nucleotide exchange factor GrpE [Acidobacteria bacterium]|nr:nucleotide exchange factor GrpE [Acidobacteriota bacterium]